MQPLRDYRRPRDEALAMDDDLMEALECMLPALPQPSDQFDHAQAAPVHPKQSIPMVDDDFQLSMEMQELFPSSPGKVTPMTKTKLPPTDRRLRPFSTAKRRNRRRPKHELEYLRVKVVELEEELAALTKAKSSALVTVSDAAKAKLSTSLVTKGVAASWEEIAERQKEGVDDSITENRKLRNRLLGQLQVARVLEAAIKQHHRDSPQTAVPWQTICGGGGAPASTSSCTRQASMINDLVFADLNNSLDSQYAEIDTVLTTTGLSHVLHELKGGFQFKRESSGMSFRHEEARLLPFSMHVLHHTIWDCLRNGATLRCDGVNALSNDHLNLVFQDTLSLPRNHQVSVTKRAAFRRYFEQDRVTFVWCSYVEIDGSDFIRLREKGWSTTSAFEFYRGVAAGTNSSSNYVQGCITRMAIQVTPEISSCESVQEAQTHVGEMTDLVVGTYQQNFGLIHEVVEDVLLKDESPAAQTKLSAKGDGSSIITSQ